MVGAWRGETGVCNALNVLVSAGLKMKIGIITIQKCNNYGADLQAYALGAKLRSMGHDAENIDYLFYKHPRHQGGKLEKPVLSISLKNRVKESLFPIIATLKSFRSRCVTRERRKRFDEWFNVNVKVGREYRSVKSLYDDSPEYDVYMVGSDQVWNPRLYSNIRPYFLDFVPKCAKCVSYASSFGVGELSGPVFYKYKQWLKKFSHVGLREESGMRIVKAMSLDAEIAHVLDPTLLLDAKEWAAVAVEPAEKPAQKYLLLYDLIASEETVALARRWARQNEWNVVRIGDCGYGPGEFIWLFAHAEAVVTNSFHGTIFSILHHKPFYSVIPNGMGNAGRIESLLAKLGLSDRMVDASICCKYELSGLVDWGQVDLRLEAARGESLDFLRRAIMGEVREVPHGLPLRCFMAQNRSNKQRATSTSGGIFRILAEHIISRGGIVYGAAFDDDFRYVRHVSAETIKDIAPLMKSKYVWSDPSKAYKDALRKLKSGREVLFTGTPCQIAAIKAMAKGYDGKLLTVDFVCHGTPRADMFASYMKELEECFGGKCITYDFRDKRMGWNFPRVNAEFTRGGVYSKIIRNDPWYIGFCLNATLREGCFACPYTTLERVADFTIADCWRIAASHPEWDDNKGTSLVMANTNKSFSMWREIASTGKIAYGEYDIDLAQMRNESLMQRARKPMVYDEVQETFEETGSFGRAATFFMTRKFVWKAKVIFWTKKLGWFYFKHRQ